MKVSAELKSLVTRQFFVKEDAIRKEMNDTLSKEYQAKLAELTDSKEWKDFIKAADKLKAKLDVMYQQSPTDYRKRVYAIASFDQRVSVKPADFVQDNVSAYLRYNPDLSKQLNDKLNELSAQRDALLINLQYEKDFDKIKALLAQYDIKL